MICCDNPVDVLSNKDAKWQS